MIGDHPTTSGSSGRAAEDRPPAQPLSLFTVLQQEFEELHGADLSARAGEPSDNLEKLYQRIHGLGLPRSASPAAASAARRLLSGCCKRWRVTGC
jgi:hypothetical protein